MILSFSQRLAEDLFAGRKSKPVRSFPADIGRRAKNKLLILAAATVLKELAVPPGNKLEALKGRYKGKHAIRINDQWRIVFRWTGSNVYEVQIVDYH